MRDGEGAPKGAPDDLPLMVSPASEATPELVDEYRGGPLATVRVLLDAHVRDDKAWSTIERSRPDDARPSPEAPKDRGGEE